ncbi:MAG: glycerophosphodiester phosphodiesterase [Myxococcales bacterium]|nr:glycerophosphodiester phosphodiesterase [Myxococcales bacterium]
MRHPFFARPTGAPVLVLGHRGAAGSAPENTFASFARALALGADVIETDLHVTRDGVPVLCHDRDIARTTDGEGAIAELDFATLQRFDAGDGRPIPSLAEALSAFPEARFNIEIKDARPGASEAVLREVREQGAAERVLLTAGVDATMARLREALSTARLEVAQGASAGDVLAFLRASRGLAAPAELPAEPMALQIPVAFQGRTLVDSALLACARHHGVEVHVWTVNDPAEMRRLRDLGVDGLVTDHPDRARSLVDEAQGPG